MVLCACEYIASLTTQADTLFICQLISIVDLDVQLPARIIFFEATGIPVQSLAGGGVQRRSLFCDGVAEELNVLFAESQIVEVHGPMRSGIVSWHVNLAFRH